MMIVKKIYIETAAFLLWLLSIIVNKTIKLEVYGEDILKKIHGSGKSAIFACWHNATHPFFYYYRNRKLCIIPVKKLRGEVLAAFAKRYGIKSELLNVDGTVQERTETVIKLIKHIKAGYDVTIAVDGPPKEKLYDVKPGSVYLAGKSGMPLLPAAMWAKRGFTMWWRWDKYIIPLPFTKVVITLGDPIYIPQNIKAEDIRKECAKLGEKIHEQTERARKLCTAVR